VQNFTDVLTHFVLQVPRSTLRLLDQVKIEAFANNIEASVLRFVRTYEEVSQHAQEQSPVRSSYNPSAEYLTVLDTSWVNSVIDENVASASAFSGVGGGSSSTFLTAPNVETTL
jgi:hypothetical protein